MVSIGGKGVKIWVKPHQNATMLQHKKPKQQLQKNYKDTANETKAWFKCLLCPLVRKWLHGARFDFPPHTESLLKHFWTSQAPCSAKLHRWDVAKSAACQRNQQ